MQVAPLPEGVLTARFRRGRRLGLRVGGFRAGGGLGTAPRGALQARCQSAAAAVLRAPEPGSGRAAPRGTAVKAGRRGNPPLEEVRLKSLPL
jgi:hypothetical protein